MKSIALLVQYMVDKNKARIWYFFNFFSDSKLTITSVPNKNGQVRNLIK